jgi:hypothetical protein
MKILITLFIFLSCFVYGSVGKITALKGEVYIEREMKQIQAQVGSELLLKDIVITKNLSKALILMNDQTSITIGKNSNMSISEFIYDEKVVQNNKASFNFGTGIYRTITGKIGKLNKSKFKIKTKTASIGIRGTVFDVAVSDDATKVGVIDGGVYYIDTKTLETFEVDKGEKLVYDDTTGGINVIKGSLQETDTIEEDNKELKEEEKKSEEQPKEEKQEDKKEEKPLNDKDKKDEKEQKNQDESSLDSQKEEKNETTKEESTPEDTPLVATGETKEEIESPVIETKNELEEKLTERDIIVGNGASNNDVFDDGIAEIVIDRVEESFEEIEEIKEEVLETNTPPEFDMPNSFSLNEDSQISLNTRATDNDLDRLTFNIESNPSQGEISFNEETGLISYIPQANFFGSDSITISVSDGINIVEQTINFTIININDLPELSEIQNTTLEEDSFLEITLDGSDVDGDSLTYSVLQEPAHGTMELDGTTGRLKYTPNANFYGTEIVSVGINDGVETVSKEIQLSVVNVNDLPVVETLTTQSTDENNVLTFSLNTSDVDNDSLTLSVPNGSDKGRIEINNDTKTITFTPNNGYAGTEQIEVLVSDGTDTVSTTVTIIVNEVAYVSEITESQPVNSLDEQLQAITSKIMNDNSDNFMEFGYIAVDSDDDGVLEPTDSYYVTGDITPSEIIESFINDQNRIDYSGGVSTMVNGTASGGTIDISVDFGNQSFSGNLNITEGNWAANINNGSVTPHGFTSSDISGSSDFGAITSGGLDGKFYGPSANSIAGQFELNTATDSTKGAFGAQETNNGL